MNMTVIHVCRLMMSLVGGGVLIAESIVAGPTETDGANWIPGVIQYQNPEGEKFSAFVLPAPDASLLRSRAADHVVILDTSASQSGAYRDRELKLVSAFSAALPSTDRLLLIASDVSAEKLTTGFVEPNSSEFDAGLQRLSDRVPLGCSNLEGALRRALDAFRDTRARSILYLGDGFSAAKLIQFPAMEKLMQDLRLAEVPVNSVAIGSRTDLVLLGSIAYHTGGRMYSREWGVPVIQGRSVPKDAELGRELVRVAKSPVFYPSAMTTRPLISDLDSSLLPPVRFDRETVLFSKELNGSRVTVNITGKVEGRVRELSWNLRSESVSGSAGFVYQAWKVADETHGMATPWAGRPLLFKFRDEFQFQLTDLSDAASVELQRKNLSQAEGLAKSLDQSDPGNANAGQILTSTKRLQVKPMRFERPIRVAQDDSEKTPDGSSIATSVDDAAAIAEKVPGTDNRQAVSQLDIDSEDRSHPKQSSLLEELTTRQRLRIQELTSEVNRAVVDSNQLAKTNFEDAVSQLKDLINVVDGALELPKSVRNPLRRKLNANLQKLQNENEVVVQMAAALRTKQSQLESRRKLMDQAERSEERMQQLIERVRALIVRGVKGESEAFEEAEEYSRIAVELDPYNNVPNQDVFNAEAFGSLDKARRMRALRADKFLAELYEVERAHVPFPDEPPILWPSAERWREITIKREKWRSVDLKNYSKQEEKIVSALSHPMKEKFDFVDATLEDVRNKLTEVYDINVILDKAKLEEESIATDTADISLSISDITLKNALKLLLDPKDLTFAIQDEVLLITTKTDGGAKKPTKAYYAGDLAIPVNPFASMMGGMGGRGGMMGGMGGGMGGMGGVMGGMGGGMGGMSGGMMGGGMF